MTTSDASGVMLTKIVELNNTLILDDVCLKCSYYVEEWEVEE